MKAGKFFITICSTILGTTICLFTLCLGQHNADVCEGECKQITDCPRIVQNFELLARSNKIKYCNTEDSIVCCPKRKNPIIAPKQEEKKIYVRKCAEFNEAIHEKYPCRTTPLIVAGEKADPKEFPHMGLFGIKRLRKAVKWVCGATLISTKFVITAAHCLGNLDANDIVIRLGELDYTRDDEDSQPDEFGVVKITSHPNFNWRKKTYDVGLLEMDREVTFNEYVKPACLPWSSGNELSELVATGWGNQGNGNYSTHLLKVTLNRLDDFNCAAAYTFDNLTQICAGSPNSKKDTCRGDSGGPLFVKHPNYSCMFTIIGITSHGRECGQSNTAGVYTRLHSVVSWIEEVVWGAPTAA